MIISPDLWRVKKSYGGKGTNSRRVEVGEWITYVKKKLKPSLYFPR